MMAGIRSGSINCLEPSFHQHEHCSQRVLRACWVGGMFPSLRASGRSLFTGLPTTVEWRIWGNHRWEWIQSEAQLLQTALGRSKFPTQLKRWEPARGCFSTPLSWIWTSQSFQGHKVRLTTMALMNHWSILQILGWQAAKMFVFTLTLQMTLTCYPHISRGDSFKSLVNSELSLLVLHLKRTFLVKDDIMRHHWKDGFRVLGARALRGTQGHPVERVNPEGWCTRMWRLDVIDVTWRFIKWRFLPWRLPLQGSGGLTVRRGA